MMKRSSIFALTMLLCLGSASAQDQPDFSKVVIKPVHVAGNIHMLEGLGGNIGVSVGPDGILIVDDQFAPLADRIRAALKTLGEGKLKFVLNTHWHWDHTHGNRAFGPEASIIAHTNARKRLEAGQKLGAQNFEPFPKEALPVITFDTSLSTHFNGEEIRAMHLPSGHTDGDSVIFFTRSNVVHMGDLFFNGKFPFVDLDSGGDVEGYMRNVEAVIAKLAANAKVIPGHGPLASVDDLKAFHRMMVETTGHVRQRMSAGKTLEQIKAEGLGDKWKSWGDSFVSADMWIATIHRAFSKK